MSGFGAKGYKARLYVEDELTAEYLKELFVFDSGSVEVKVAGCVYAVKGIVALERKHGCVNAYGLIDKDFGRDNHDKWHEEGTELVRGTCHEIENYLLDAVSMKACEKASINDRFDFESELKSIAGKMVCAVACCDVIAGLRKTFFDDFPRHPSIFSITSEKQACEYIVNTDWVTSMEDRAKESLTEKSIASRVHAAVVRYTSNLNDGTWAQTFPGKELFGQVRQCAFADKVSLRDFAMSIAKYQRVNNRVPAELQELYDIICQ